LPGPGDPRLDALGLPVRKRDLAHNVTHAQGAVLHLDTRPGSSARPRGQRDAKNRRNLSDSVVSKEGLAYIDRREDTTIKQVVAPGTSKQRLPRRNKKTLGRRTGEKSTN